MGVSFERHAAVGARLMLRQRGFHEAKTRRVLAVLQHHRDANDPLRPGLFGRILRVAEDYDTLARRGGKLPPTMALAGMLKWAGTRYDAVLLQLLVNALGAYPPGTLLRLEDGRVVRSVTPARGPETFAQPLARCLRLADGSEAPGRTPPRGPGGDGGRASAAARPARSDRRVPHRRLRSSVGCYDGLNEIRDSLRQPVAAVQAGPRAARRPGEPRRKSR